METAINMDKSLIAGGNNSSIYIYNTYTDELQYKLDKGYYLQFNGNDTVLRIEQNGRFSIYNLKTKEISLEKKLPFRPEFTLPGHCWYDDKTIYFRYAEKSKALVTYESRSVWHLVKYLIDKDIFIEMPFVESIVGKWKNYFLTTKYVEEDETKDCKYALRFYKNDSLFNQIYIGCYENAFIYDDCLYFINEEDNKFCVFEVKEDFSCYKILELEDLEVTRDIEFSINERYISLHIGYDEDSVLVFNRQNNELVFKEVVPYIMNINLVRNKLYVGTMDKLHVFKLD